MNESDQNNNDKNLLSEKIKNPSIKTDNDEEYNINEHSPKINEKIKDEIFNNDFHKNIIQNKIFLIPKLAPIKFVICKVHNKEYLKLAPNNFEVVCEKCVEEGNESQLEIINTLESEENNYNCI